MKGICQSLDYNSWAKLILKCQEISQGRKWEIEHLRSYCCCFNEITPSPSHISAVAVPECWIIQPCVYTAQLSCPEWSGRLLLSAEWQCHFPVITSVDAITWMHKPKIWEKLCLRKGQQNYSPLHSVCGFETFCYWRSNKDLRANKYLHVSEKRIAGVVLLTSNFWPYIC